MSMEYIREHWQVPAKRGMRIKFRGRPATITGSRDALLLVRFDDDDKWLGPMRVHPTWEIEWPEVTR